MDKLGNYNGAGFFCQLTHTGKEVMPSRMYIGGASMFTSVFLRMGGGEVVSGLILATPSDDKVLVDTLTVK